MPFAPSMICRRISRRGPGGREMWAAPADSMCARAGCKAAHGSVRTRRRPGSSRHAARRNAHARLPKAARRPLAHARPPTRCCSRWMAAVMGANHLSSMRRASGSWAAWPRASMDRCSFWYRARVASSACTGTGRRQHGLKGRSAGGSTAAGEARRPASSAKSSARGRGRAHGC